ncbi:MAG: DUF309 domain-containing protein [Hydrogenimonas sp.]|nr:DUF309 domain-containing protein [Hydrogenimonas sp.]
MGEACEAFIRHIEAGEYYEAHEVLEEVWFPRRFEDSDEIRLIKGFINASVSFELHKRGRSSPSEKTWQVYLKYRPLIDKIDKSESLHLYRRIESVLEKVYEDLFRP